MCYRSLVNLHPEQTCFSTKQYFYYFALFVYLIKLETWPGSKILHKRRYLGMMSGNNNNSNNVNNNKQMGYMKANWNTDEEKKINMNPNWSELMNDNQKKKRTKKKKNPKLKSRSTCPFIKYNLLVASLEWIEWNEKKRRTPTFNPFVIRHHGNFYSCYVGLEWK